MIVVTDSGVIAAEQTPVIIADHKDVVTITQPAGALVSVAGSRGPMGPPGVTAGLQVLVTGSASSRPLGANRAVCFEAGALDYAHTWSSADVVGFTVNAVAEGASALVQSSGELEGFYGLVTGSPVYLANNGLVTQTVPFGGRLQNLGVALSPTKVFIQIQPPLYLLGAGINVSPPTAADEFAQVMSFLSVIDTPEEQAIVKEQLGVHDDVDLGVF